MRNEVGSVSLDEAWIMASLVHDQSWVVFTLLKGHIIVKLSLLAMNTLTTFVCNDDNR